MLNSLAPSSTVRSATMCSFCLRAGRFRYRSLLAAYSAAVGPLCASESAAPRPNQPDDIGAAPISAGRSHVTTPVCVLK